MLLVPISVRRNRRKYVVGHLSLSNRITSRCARIHRMLDAAIFELTRQQSLPEILICRKSRILRLSSSYTEPAALIGRFKSLDPAAILPYVPNPFLPRPCSKTHSLPPSSPSFRRGDGVDFKTASRPAFSSHMNAEPCPYQ